MALTISTKDLKSRKNVEIDGHHYIVRRFGAGEQLSLNQLLREANKVQDSGDEDKALSIFGQVIDIFAGVFDDGGDGSKSRELISRLSQEEIEELFKQIFPEESDAAPTGS